MTYHTPFVNGEDADQDTFNLRAGENGAAIDDQGDGSLAMPTPAITSFTNSPHDHEDAAGGGQLTLDALAQSGAATGEVPQWDGADWVPATVDLSVLTAKGDLATYSSAGPGVAALAAGQDGAPLVYDSAQAAGLKAGGANYKYFQHESVKVYNSANQSVPHNTNTILTWDSEAFDDSGYHDTGSNTSRLTALYTGRYVVRMVIQIGDKAATPWDINIKLNGASYVYTMDETVEANIPGDSSFAIPLELNADDYIEVEVFQFNGGATNATVQGGSTKSFFSMDYLGTI